MAFLQYNFYSSYLHADTNVNVILPDLTGDMQPEAFYTSGRRYPVLYLLHGLTGDYSNWMRYTGIERYACDNDLIVVMPSAANSEYSYWPAPMTLPYDFPNYFIHELMPMVHHWLPASAERADNFIGGLSMGGGGALRIAAYWPERFAGCAVLSSCAWNMDFLKEFADMDTETFYAKMQKPENRDFLDSHGVPNPYLSSICKYGTVEEFLHSYDNTRSSIRTAVNAGTMPRVYNAIGTQDDGYEKFLDYRSFCGAIGADMRFDIYEGYGHVWELWDIAIRQALKYFGFNK